MGEESHSGPNKSLGVTSVGQVIRWQVLFWLDVEFGFVYTASKRPNNPPRLSRLLTRLSGFLSRIAPADGLLRPWTDPWICSQVRRAGDPGGSLCHQFERFHPSFKLADTLNTHIPALNFSKRPAVPNVYQRKLFRFQQRLGT